MGMRRSALVAIGAALGAGIRWIGLELEWGNPDQIILALNLLGTALLATVIEWRGKGVSTQSEALMGAGFCGALTTWSSLALLTADHLKHARFTHALLWLGANIAAGLVVAAAAKAVQAQRRPPPVSIHSGPGP